MGPVVQDPFAITGLSARRVLALAQKRGNPLVVSVEHDGALPCFSADEQRNRVRPGRAA